MRATAALYNQLISEIEAIMRAALQVTDTDEAMRLKATQRRHEKDLRKELMKVAELEETRPVFKCGVYEVLKLLSNSLMELFTAFEKEETLKKAMVRNLWTVLRPNITEQKFEKVTQQPWAEHLQMGTHRLKQSWIDKRFEHLDEQGFPKAWREDKIHESQLDASYCEEPGSLLELNTWKMMAETGEMTEEALKSCSLMPWMEYELNNIPDFEGLEEAKELMISPKTKRLQAGLDVHLSSQGPSAAQRRARKKRGG